MPRFLTASRCSEAEPGREPAPRPTASRRHRLWLAPAVLVFLAAGLLFAFDPSQVSFYPVCFFHRFTGLLCPGCGSLRAIHHLLHGHWLAAFHLNPLLFLVGFLVAGRACWYAVRKRVDPGVRLTVEPAWLWALVALVALFSVIRNLPGIPFPPLK